MMDNCIKTFKTVGRYTLEIISRIFNDIRPQRKYVIPLRVIMSRFLLKYDEIRVPSRV